MPKYDFTDQAVYNLVLGTHRPIEVWSADKGVVPSELQLLCDVDRESWPCTAVRELRAYDKQKAATQQQSGAAIHQQRIREGRING